MNYWVEPKIVKPIVFTEWKHVWLYFKANTNDAIYKAIRKYKQDPLFTDNDRENLLMKAIKYGHVDMLPIVVEM